MRYHGITWNLKGFVSMAQQICSQNLLFRSSHVSPGVYISATFHPGSPGCHSELRRVPGTHRDNRGSSTAVPLTARSNKHKLNPRVVSSDASSSHVALRTTWGDNCQQVRHDDDDTVLSNRASTPAQYKLQQQDATCERRSCFSSGKQCTASGCQDNPQLFACGAFHAAVHFLEVLVRRGCVCIISTSTYRLPCDTRT